MNKDRMRGMRGLIRRVRGGGYVRDRKLFHRVPMLRNVYKVCNWCQEETDEPRRRYWHSHCLVWSAASKGMVDPYVAHKGRFGPYQWRSREEYDDYYADWDMVHACVQCGSKAVLEIEHELAISVAIELGADAIMRTFMPDNYRYMCHECHLVKTRQDRLILKILRSGIKPPVPAIPLNQLVMNLD